MNILEKIITHKYTEVLNGKNSRPVTLLEKSSLFERTPLSLKKSLQTPNSSGIIAEFKRKSPSKNIINDQIDVKTVTQGYTQAGAAGLSVLTDKEFFGGENRDLQEARGVNQIPLLRKDFIIDEYQIVEAKAIGADVILLISACLDGKKLKELAQFAKSLGLDVLMEVHNLEELQNTLNEYVDMVGVNNRNLKTFDVSIQTSLDLAEHIPQEFVKVSESGLSNPETIVELRKAGFQGFLIGENFMKEVNPGEACKQFIEQLKSVKI